MLLRQEVADGVEVLSVRGPVEDDDAQPLLAAVSEAIAHQPRAVVLDLGQAGELSDGVRGALRRLPPLPPGRPRAALVVHPPSTRPQLLGWLCAADVDEAFAQVDRRARPRTRVDVEHGPCGPAQARSAVSACADELGLGEESDDLVLLVSELVTNAVRYAAPPVCVEISASDRDVVLAVRDGSPYPPQPREAGDDAEGGRGMLLVDLLAAEHGVRSDPPGKAVWARLRRTRRS